MSIKNIIKITSMVTISSLLFIGCASSEEPTLSTIQPTDFAMSCEALIQETKKIKIALEDEKDSNFAKNVAGAVLTLGIYSADKTDETVLRERLKSLQLIYAMKQAKGECRTLTKEDIQVDNKLVRTVNEVKDTIKKVSNNKVDK